MNVQGNNQRSLLAVFAHPDDEACGPAGTLARYASEGVKVTLVCLTRGGAQGLADLREQEVARSAKILGVSLELWDYPDSGLAYSDTWEIYGRLVELIRRLHPQVILTFGTSQITEHPDHVMAGWLATLAFEMAGGCARWPSTLPGYALAKLYFAIDPDMARRLALCCLSVVNVAPYLSQRLAALECHQSQRFCIEAFLRQRVPQGLDREYFQLAACRIPFPSETQHDLFEGIDLIQGAR